MHRPRSSTLLALVACAALGAPAPARAHAVLVDSSPRDGAVLEAAPDEATLRFNSRIEKQLTRVGLEDAAGHALTVDRVERAGEPPDVLTVRLPALAAGSYRLTYRVLAVDGHATPGQVRFTVEAAAKP
jgi:copper resistance protein C